MDSATQQVEQQLCAGPLEGDIYHPPRPSAESRFYSITVGKKPGVYRGMYVFSLSISVSWPTNNGCQSDDWHSQVDGVSGSAVRSFDTLEAAKQAFGDANSACLVYQVEQIGERRILTEEDVQSIPGMRGRHDYIYWTCFSINYSTR